MVGVGMVTVGMVTVGMVTVGMVSVGVAQAGEGDAVDAEPVGVLDTAECAGADDGATRLVVSEVKGVGAAARCD
jgi:hypothetical protein